MLPPKAVRPLLKYFDSIDSCVARKLVRKRPWQEPALTSLLCDLMDADAQEDYILRRDLAWLNKRLSRAVPLLELRFDIDTHEYPSSVERYVTQSDLGLVVRYEDNVKPELGWEAACLLQAKKLYLDSTGKYSLSSDFRAKDQKQRSRAEKVNKALDCELIRYLLYCPRPEDLDTSTAAILRHLRDLNISKEIFDFTQGMELYANLLSRNPILDAGLVVAPVSAVPKTLAQTYEQMFSESLPWAWFLTFWLTGTSSCGAAHPLMEEMRSDRQPDIASRIVKGNPAAVRELLQQVGELDARDFRFMPANTVTITASIGPNLERDQTVQ
ncbi:hypothetical protein ACIHDR_43070 [Nocardia sp. NPDC052278]|uniref:hypothetical protein n=1 Tax=unclassified Nocardia TaxID=2637762 RepID=UPI0036A65D45